MLIVLEAKDFAKFVDKCIRGLAFFLHRIFETEPNGCFDDVPGYWGDSERLSGRSQRAAGVSA